MSKKTEASSTTPTPATPNLGLAGRHLSDAAYQPYNPAEATREQLARNERSRAAREAYARGVTRPLTAEEIELRRAASAALDASRAADALASETHQRRLAAAKRGDLRPPVPSAELLVKARSVAGFNTLSVEEQRAVELYNASGVMASRPPKGGW